MGRVERRAGLTAIVRDLGYAVLEASEGVAGMPAARAVRYADRTSRGRTHVSRLGQLLPADRPGRRRTDRAAVRGDDAHRQHRAQSRTARPEPLHDADGVP